MKKLFPISTLAVLTLAIFAGCSKPPAKKAGGGVVPVLVAKAGVTNVPVQMNPPPVGHVTAFSTVTVHSQIGGLMQAVHFQEGQEVKKGDLLFSIDPRPTQAALSRQRPRCNATRRLWNMRK